MTQSDLGLYLYHFKISCFQKYLCIEVLDITKNVTEMNAIESLFCSPDECVSILKWESKETGLFRIVLL